MKNSQEDIKKQQQRKSPEGRVPAIKQKHEVSNTANYQGAVDEGRSGTKATASQQQGQGAQNAKDHNNRSGSDSGQNTNKKTR